jgi:uncharacterized protein DUF3560
MNIPVPAPIPAISATLRHDPISHYHWLELAERCSDEDRAELKRAGWRWSRYREQWYTNRRYYAIPAGFTVTDAGKCDYASERAERLEERAGKHYTRYQERHEKAHVRASMIPFGQPILVGHHSERRHRRDLDRIHNDYGKAFAELEASNDLKGKAAASTRHQAHKQTAPAMARRLERLNVEKRQLQRNLDGITPQYRAAHKAGEENISAYQQRLQWRMDTVRAEIAELEQAIEDAGGLLADHTEVHPGDLVNLRGYTVRVTRVNPKSYSGVIVMPENRGLNGWKGKWDRTDFRGIVRRADEPPTAAEVINEQNQTSQQGEEPDK